MFQILSKLASELAGVTNLVWAAMTGMLVALTKKAKLEIYCSCAAADIARVVKKKEN